jgi:putative serine protease PepD
MSENSAPQGPHTTPQQQPQGAAWWHSHATAPPGHGHPAGGQPPHSGAPSGTGRPRRAVSGSIVAVALIAGLVGGGAGVGGMALLSDGSDSPVLASQPPAAASNVSSQPGSVAAAAKTAMKSTVDIKVATQRGTATGTGIVLTPDGYVMTNNHVVAGAGNGGKIQVTTPDGQKHAAAVKGTSPSYDLAVIKLDGVSGLTPAVLGQSSALQVGQPVAAVGSPEQLSYTVTSGIVSALSRTVTAGGDDGQTVVYNGIQTDAPINPGNSGGPLVNMDGQVVAVNSAIESGQASSGGPQAFGLGFSIPIDTARRVANELLQHGTASKPMLGVSGSLGAQGQSSDDGARIASVQPGGPAERAGIRQGDAVTSVDGSAIGSYPDLMAQVLKHTPGQQVPIAVRHADGSQQTVTATLGGAPDTEQTTVPSQQGDQQSPFGGQGEQQSPFGGQRGYGEQSPYGGQGGQDGYGGPGGY